MFTGTMKFGSRIILLAGAVHMAGMTGCSAPVRTVTEEEFRERVAGVNERSIEQRNRFANRFLRRLELLHGRNLAAGIDVPVEVNVLLLSSGGQYGAFGTGVLNGWSATQSRELGRPEFDVVTGVSTGALIAPFAISGADDSIQRVADLFQEVDDTFARLRGVLFFLPWRTSMFDTSELRRRVQSEVDEDLVESVALAHDQHRMLLIGAVDLDLGRFHIWDMGGIAAHARETRELRPFHDAMISSASIPGAFPPIEIDDVLYTDGAAAQATFLGLDRYLISEVVQAFLDRNPGAVVPQLRMWMIVNGHIDPPIALSQQGWTSVALRSAAVISSYSLRGTLRQMQLGCEIIGRDIGRPIEFRYISVPLDVELPEASGSLFDRELMASLHALGRDLGSDPLAWRTDAISPDVPGTLMQLRPIVFEPQE